MSAKANDWKTHWSDTTAVLSSTESLCAGAVPQFKSSLPSPTWSSNVNIGKQMHLLPLSKQQPNEVDKSIPAQVVEEGAVGGFS